MFFLDFRRSSDFERTLNRLVLRSTMVRVGCEFLICYFYLIIVTFTFTSHSHCPSQTHAYGRDGLILVGVINFDDEFIEQIRSDYISAHHCFNCKLSFLSQHFCEWIAFKSLGMSLSQDWQLLWKWPTDLNLFLGLNKYFWIIIFPLHVLLCDLYGDIPNNFKHAHLDWRYFQRWGGILRNH